MFYLDVVFESDLWDGYITFSSSHSFVLILGMALIMVCIDFSEAVKLDGYMLIVCLYVWKSESSSTLIPFLISPLSIAEKYEYDDAVTY